MTDKDMNKLADLIIAKLKVMQEALDESFFTKMSGEDWEVEKTEPITVQSMKALIEQLEKDLKEALVNENYELAQSINKRLKEYKGKE